MSGINMTEAEQTRLDSAQLLDFLKSLAWCKQADETLVAVHKGTPEIIDMLKDNELRIFPGDMLVKMQKSTLHHFQTGFDDGTPLPVVLAWKSQGLEIWYRRNNPAEFPYDAWTNQALQSLERDRVFVPTEKFGADAAAAHAEIMGRVKECPSMIPPH